MVVWIRFTSKDCLLDISLCPYRHLHFGLKNACPSIFQLWVDSNDSPLLGDWCKFQNKQKKYSSDSNHHKIIGVYWAQYIYMKKRNQKCLLVIYYNWQRISTKASINKINDNNQRLSFAFKWTNDHLGITFYDDLVNIICATSRPPNI